MSERYQNLFTLPENLYTAGAPVLIAAGALLKDNQTGKVLAQLKLKNINKKAIKAMTVKIKPFDTVGNSLGDEIEYLYLDLTAKRNAFFGQKTPIILPNATTRAFSVIVSEVIFGDNSIWLGTAEPWESLLAPAPLVQELKDKELAKQYRIKYGKDCKNLFKAEKDLWYCPCGALNHKEETTCHLCKKEAAALSSPDWDSLKKLRDERIIKEKAAAEKKAAEEKAAAEVQKQKTMKLAKIGIPILIVIIIGSVMLYKSSSKKEAYNEAVAMVEAGEYNSAISTFADLGDYKDSQAQLETLVEEILGIPPIESNLCEVHYDKTKACLVISAFYSVEDPSVFEKQIQEYGEDKFYNEVSYYSEYTWNTVDDIFDEHGIDISHRIEVYATTSSSEPLGSYPEEYN